MTMTRRCRSHHIALDSDLHCRDKSHGTQCFEMHSWEVWDDVAQDIRAIVYSAYRVEFYDLEEDYTPKLDGRDALGLTPHAASGHGLKHGRDGR